MSNMSTTQRTKYPQISTTTGTTMQWTEGPQISTAGRQLQHAIPGQQNTPGIATNNYVSSSATPAVSTTWTTTMANGSSLLDVMVDVISGFELLSIDFTNSEITRQCLERLIKENYRYKDEIGEMVRLALSDTGSAALTLPWLFAYLFSKRAEYEDCAAYVEDICNRKFVKNGTLSLIGPSENIWSLFTCHEGTLAKISLEFAAFCRALQ